MPFVSISNNAAEFFRIYLVLLMDAFASSSFGLMFSAGCKDQATVQSIGGALTIPMMVMAGNYVNLGTVSWAIRWLAYLAPSKYAYEALIWEKYPPVDGQGSIPESQGMYLGYVACMWILLAFGFICRFLSYLLLIYRSKDPI